MPRVRWVYVADRLTGAGVFQVSEPLAQLTPLPPWVEEGLNTGAYIFQESVGDIPAPIAVGAHQPDWRALSVELATLLAELCPRDPPPRVASALDAYQLALMAEAAVTEREQTRVEADE